MTETYRLVFRGEVLDGQHKAVVKQRLGVALKLEGERLDALFTGKAVTIRKSADTDTAARFQVAFKRAGARLRVLPVETDARQEAPGVAPSAAPASPPAGDLPAFDVAPPGTPLADVRPAPRPPAVDTSHFSLAAVGSNMSEPRVAPPVAVPDTSHLTVAAVGSNIGEEIATPDITVDVPAWKLANVGANLAPRKAPAPPPVDVDAIDFDVAPPGARLAEPDGRPQPVPPDTSHIHLQ
jgi:hypothetical protein